VTAGWVRLTPDRTARLLEEAIRLELSEPVGLEETARAALQRSEGEFLVEVQRRAPTPSVRAGSGVGPLRPELFPPCVRKMWRVLAAGENLSHAGRFALAAFLYRAGASLETIVDAYRGAPDFDEGITRYQVEHITQRNGGAGYEPPECATIRSHGLCFREGDPTAAEAVDRQRDPICFDPKLRHPMQYYRWRGGVRSERSSGSGSPA
jgi:DNA primase large subunit